uniref:Uncharacterized protein n=1 Tax=Lactuca sativa TaxID=4236 RepID=A0A9R1VUI6_LACSA|nr:hypothetical protein LSAT_V11C400209650 [Lactuca sativa]
MRSCVFDVTGLLSDIIETRYFEDDVLSKTRGRKENIFKVQTNENPKAPIKPPVIKQQLKRKEKLFNKEPIIDDSEDEEPDEAKLKR